jgi:hypothetical protein
MRRLVVAAVLAACFALPAAAHAGPRLYALVCAFGDGRTHVLARRLEAMSDDPLVCWADVADVSERLAPRLAGELRATGGRARPLTLAAFEARQDRAQRAQAELIVPHDVWFPRVDWRGARPRLHLVLQVYDKRGSARRARWRRLLVSTLDVGHRRVYAGTPSFKDAYPTWTHDPTRQSPVPVWSRVSARSSNYPSTPAASNGRDDYP